SVLFFGVKVGRDAVIEDSVILPNSSIASGSHIKNSIIGRNVTIEKNSQIGVDSDSDQIKITVVGDEELIPESSQIKSGTVVG
ncbi:MAG: glucose-1-phosphate adenylyltransferase, partial [Halanaerobium sp. MSAO_Bac5]